MPEIFRAAPIAIQEQDLHMGAGPKDVNHAVPSWAIKQALGQNNSNQDITETYVEYQDCMQRLALLCHGAHP